MLFSNNSLLPTSLNATLQVALEIRTAFDGVQDIIFTEIPSGEGFVYSLEIVENSSSIPKEEISRTKRELSHSEARQILRCINKIKVKGMDHSSNPYRIYDGPSHSLVVRSVFNELSVAWADDLPKGWNSIMPLLLNLLWLTDSNQNLPWWKKSVLRFVYIHSRQIGRIVSMFYPLFERNRG